ncbi:MAG TPA: hypothetical protein VGJ02_00045, partial [Pyrinomonadaceae bacterium]
MRIRKIFGYSKTTTAVLLVLAGTLSLLAAGFYTTPKTNGSSAKGAGATSKTFLGQLPSKSPFMNFLGDATVTTDLADYAPGATVNISGSGFWSNEIVTLQVIHTDGTAEGGEGHEPWTVIADANGNFSSSWYVNPDDSVGSSFKLTAIGASSGFTAATTFTDNIGVNLDQCQNIDLTHLNDPCGTVGNGHPDWANGDINKQNSQYREGDGLPYRAAFTQVP